MAMGKRRRHAKQDGRTHLAHKAEHAVDLETGAVVGVTVQDAHEGDTVTSIETLIEAAEQVETVVPDGEIKEVVADKGYHSNQVMVDLEAVGVRSYISEPDRGRRNWKDHPDARGAVYRNRRRIRGARGTRLLRQRGERLELMRTLFGVGTPRGLQGRAAALFATLWWLLWHPVMACSLICGRNESQTTLIDLHKAPHVRGITGTVERAFATGC